MKKRLKIAVLNLFQDAGEATRAFELARGMRENCPDTFEPEFTFLSHGSAFDEKFRKDGFPVRPVEPKLPGIGFRNDLKVTAFQMVGDVNLATELLQGEVEALHELQPDILLHGFWPIAGIAAKLTRVPIELCYLPIPFEKQAFSTFLMQDLPDIMGPLTALPVGIRQKLMAAIPKSIKLKSPLLGQSNIQRAYEAVGRSDLEFRDLFDMLRSDFTVVNDFPLFYEGETLPENFAVTGPLFSPDGSLEHMDPEIVRQFRREEGETRVFCTLGSSGTKENLLEAIRALRMPEMSRCKSVVLCPPSVCSLEEARRAAAGSKNLYLTDSFVPALKINGMADIVLSHGGQGTVQTAVASGTPIVGFAVQPEQQINLDHIVNFGAAIRLPIRQWKAPQIVSSLRRVADSPCYRENMHRLQKMLLETDGKKAASEALWHFIISKI